MASVMNGATSKVRNSMIWKVLWPSATRVVINEHANEHTQSYQK